MFRKGDLAEAWGVLADSEASTGLGWKQSKQNRSTCLVEGQWVWVGSRSRLVDPAVSATPGRFCLKRLSPCFGEAGRRGGYRVVREYSPSEASQRSLQNEPIFRLLLKVAVMGAHQCEYDRIFCGVQPQQLSFGRRGGWKACEVLWLRARRG